MTAKIIPFRRLELEHTAFGRRHLTPEQRAHRSAMSKRPRRSKNGTPEERAAKVAASVGVEVRAISRSDVLLEPPPLTKEEFKANDPHATAARPGDDVPQRRAARRELSSRQSGRERLYHKPPIKDSAIMA
jgi:hypothetical protein